MDSAHSGRGRHCRRIVTASAFAVLFVSALAVSLALRVWLAYRHMGHVAAFRDGVPAASPTAVWLPAHLKAADYTVARTRLSVAETLGDSWCSSP